eukprot:TRINITY_DN59452_c0_g1_i2.p1 TRINITY_DN59452_c0_g1~~TRINITY_DN59452_c0_g1_i2.p1  ORF type:complete len:375 (-),score=94.04 TRINITY_DN59452_c0_g1_i2:1081-2184(-)
MDVAGSARIVDEDGEYVEAQENMASAEEQEPSASDAAPEAEHMQIACEWPYEGSVSVWLGSAPTLERIEEEVAAAAELGDGAAYSEGCRVLHHRRNTALPDLWAATSTEEQRSFFQGVLSEDDSIAPLLTANITARPWRYSVDGNEYIGGTVGGNHAAFGPKQHYLSLFYLSKHSICDGKAPQKWGVEEANAVAPGHVFVDDGTEDIRRQAFGPYHFTVICGGAEEAPLVPQAMVDAFGFACHPLVHRDVHDRFARVLFHLPEAAQAYSRIHPLQLLRYVEDLYTDPEKNEALFFKQTFMFLMQDLFRYRYRQPPRQRLWVSACALCEDKRRQERLRLAAEGTSAASPAAEGASGGWRWPPYPSLSV